MLNVKGKDGQQRLIASNRVEGTSLYNQSGEKVGTIQHFMVDKESGQVAYAVLQFGGLLGLGSDHYPLPWSILQYDTSRGGYVADIDKAKLERAPRHAFDTPWNDAYGAQVGDYWEVLHPSPFI